MPLVQQKGRRHQGDTSYRPTSHRWLKLQAYTVCNLHTRTGKQASSSPGNSGCLSKQWWWPTGPTRECKCSHETYTFPHYDHVDNITMTTVRRTRGQVSLKPSGVEVQVTPFIHILLLSTIIFFFMWHKTFMNATLEGTTPLTKVSLVGWLTT